MFAGGPRWRATEWEEPEEEWRYLAAFCIPLIEQLRERFIRKLIDSFKVYETCYSSSLAIGLARETRITTR